MSVIWITGLSGSGKTTIAKAIVKKMTTKEKIIIFLDGDELRKVFKTEDKASDFNYKNRLLNAQKISRLGCLLSSQGHTVVISTMSMFKEIYEWNRENINKYFEVFINLPMEELIKRDSKKIYSKYLSGNLTNVVGMDLTYDKPLNPNLIISNFKIEHLSIIVNKIIDGYEKEVVKVIK